MACIKCGQETANGTEFCEDCLEEMTRYPVKPGTPVILPKREEQQTARHNRKKTLKPELQIANYKKAMRVLWGVVIILLLLLAAAAALIWLLWDEATVTSLLT